MSVGRRHYGKLPVKISGRDEWERQDATGTWSDDGEVRRLVEQSVNSMIGELEEVVARNVVLGASEYISSGEAAATIDDQGDLVLGIRIWNDNASMITYIPLKQFLVSVLSDVRPLLGVDPVAQAMISQFVSIGRGLAALGAPPSKPPQQAQKGLGA